MSRMSRLVTREFLLGSLLVLALPGVLSCAGLSGAALSVSETRVTVSVEGFAPAAGKKFVIVSVEVSNHGGDGFPVVFAQFRLVTSDNLSTVASAQSAVISGACAQNALVETGGSTRCDVMFEIGFDLEPRRILFQSSVGRTASAGIDFPECAWCGNDCVDVQRDPANCGECGLAVVEGQRCVEGRLECDDPSLTPCPGACDDLSTSARNCGECGRALPENQDCSGGTPVCNVPGQEFCGDDCVDFRTDSKHCGGCDRPVKGEQVCRSGYPDCPQTNQEFCDPACANLAVDTRHCGGCFRPVQPPRICIGGVPACDGGKTFCDNLCVDLMKDEAHCGECGRSCPDGLYCVDGLACEDKVTARAWQTCDTTCDKLGYTCVGGTATFMAFGDSSCYCYEPDLKCAELPQVPAGCPCPQSDDVTCRCQLIF